MISDDKGRKRLSLSIDPQDLELLNELQKTLGGSRSEIVANISKIIASNQSVRSRGLTSVLSGIEGSSPLSAARSNSFSDSSSAALAGNHDLERHKSTHQFSNNDLKRSAPGLYLDRFHARNLENLELSTASVIIPIKAEAAGTLIECIPVIWNEIIDCLERDWGRIYELPPEKFEELIASTFDRAGYDEVILTPRSRDHGRDVIAFKHGVGCIKIIGSVKRYSRDNRVRHDDVRALLGVLSGEQDSSKVQESPHF